MSINDLMINVGFETGSFPPWIPFNALITSLYTQSEFNAARLTGGTVNSYIYQIVPINPGESYEFIVSLSKVGAAQSPPVSLSIPYYDAGFNFIGYRLIT